MLNLIYFTSRHFWPSVSAQPLMWVPHLDSSPIWVNSLGLFPCEVMNPARASIRGACSLVLSLRRMDGEKGAPPRGGLSSQDHLSLTASIWFIIVPTTYHLILKRREFQLVQRVRFPLQTFKCPMHSLQYFQFLFISCCSFCGLVD